jgi:hypothetical protein
VGKVVGNVFGKGGKVLGNGGSVLGNGNGNGNVFGRPASAAGAAPASSGRGGVGKPVPGVFGLGRLGVTLTTVEPGLIGGGAVPGVSTSALTVVSGVAVVSATSGGSPASG